MGLFQPGLIGARAALFPLAAASDRLNRMPESHCPSHTAQVTLPKTRLAAGPRE